MKKQNAIADEILQFRSDLMSVMPFYGELLSRFEIAESRSIPTAATDGRMIYYNGNFFKGLSRGARNYILMHELMHIILLHPHRAREKDEKIWNVAADFVVNGLLDSLIASYGGDDCRIAFEKPPCGCFMDEYYGESVEQLYQGILEGNRKNLLKIIYVFVTDQFGETKQIKVTEKDLDLIVSLPQKELDQMAEQIKKWIDEAGKNWSNDPSSEHIKRNLLLLKNEKRLPWKIILKRFLREYETKEVSYDHPERKYLHMDMILPGEGRDPEDFTLENVWAFIDSSGSISSEDSARFITELYHICKQFHATINIGYWDVKMHEVYQNVTDKNILEAVPSHFGGTDAEAVYDYLDQNKVKADVILILTDGYFYPVPLERTKRYRNKTIVVLSEYGTEPQYELGKIAKL